MTTAADLVAQLTLDEKAVLLVGKDAWHTHDVPRIGLNSFRLSDGPNGVRGGAFGPTSKPAFCLPCGSAVGATWDPALAQRLGELLGQQARLKDVRVVLAPTANLHRSPLGGRTFESYSEDPFLSARLAVGAVRGIQSQGVAATMKHYIANEVETNRNVSSSGVDERTLRELYLLPFEATVKEAGVLAVMTSYNRVNGEWVSQSRKLLQEVLRDEWGFEGLVMSDWNGAVFTKASIEAGMDLIMPGPERVYGAALAKAVRDGEVEEKHVDAAALRLLGVFERLGALDDPTPGPEGGEDDPQVRVLLREASAASMVLLKNEGVLPLAQPRSIAVIGPNAVTTQIMGGGSASLRPWQQTAILSALQERHSDVRYEAGCSIAPVIAYLQTPFPIEVFAGHEWAGEPIRTKESTHTIVLFTESMTEGQLTRDRDVPFSARGRFTYTPTESGPHELGLVTVGRGRVLVDGVEVASNLEGDLVKGAGLFGLAFEQEVGQLDLVEGTPIEVVVEYLNDGFPSHCVLQVGIRPALPASPIPAAARLAAECEAVVLVVGTTADHETEGRDRTTLALPGDQDELARAVLAANPNTVVVVNAGSPVTLPWADEAKAVVTTWFGGEEMAHALVDVLLGESEPSGRLPSSFPKRLEDLCSFGSFPGDNLETPYAEGVLMGYRWHQTRKIAPAFAFGHGLSYTSFEIGEPTLEGLTVTVPVANTGSRRGAEVVQLYVASLDPWVVRPEQELKGFQKTWLEPGESTTLTFVLDQRSFAHWNEPMTAEAIASVPDVVVWDRPRPEREVRGWIAAPGRYEIRVGRSSEDLPHALTLRIDENTF